MKHVVFLTLLLFSLSSFAISDKTEISVVTCSPGTEVYEIFGHAAIHVIDPENNIDVIFNYGTFSYFSDNFLLKFVKGETDYMLTAEDSENFYWIYSIENRAIYEQVLNLTYEEKQLIWNKLVWNSQRENRTYRYNFFFDNCATRPLDIILDCIGDSIVLPNLPSKTFRELVLEYSHVNPWEEFGINLAVGVPADQIATSKEQSFLPDYLMQLIKGATIERNGISEPLVKEDFFLSEATPVAINTINLFTPGSCFWTLFIITTVLSFLLFRKIDPFLWDSILFGSCGLFGCILFFISFFSEHPCVFPNYNLIWSNPLQLIFALLILFKKIRKYVEYYHFFNAFTLSLFIISIPFISQNIDKNAVPIILFLMVRSFSYILKYFFQQKQLQN